METVKPALNEGQIELTLQMTAQKKTRSRKGVYRIQLYTAADFESAQGKKYSLSKVLGPSVEILFDPPFYKIRYGRYSTREKARSRLLDIKDLGFQGFIIKE